MGLLDYRLVYKPFEYPKAYEYMKLQQNNFWLPSEVDMSRDIEDWKNKLTDSERLIIGQILKSFVQSETHISEYWSSNVTRWFPKHEIVGMAVTFGAFEQIHSEGYDYLNVELGLEDYEAFTKDPTAMAKLSRLQTVDGSSKQEIARSLAIFSACTEGTSLFSSFVILANMSRLGYMKGVKNIIEWSQRDELFHAVAGAWLFRTFVQEHPEVLTKEFKKELYEAMRLTVELEDNFIDGAFTLGDMRGLDPKDLKNFIRDRANSMLLELGLKTNWKNIDQDSLERMSWFSQMSYGVNNTDFFSARVTDYAKVNWKVGDLFK